jgi:hypothetical protein
MPGYRSVAADGKTAGRETILASTRSHAASPDYRTKVIAWRREHPSHGEVALFGDTAVLTWVSEEAGSEGRIRSCDVFVYRAGRWRAIYSQHID